MIDPPPFFNWTSVPEEREHAHHVYLQLIVLGSLEMQFRSAVRLYDHTQMVLAETPPGQKVEISNWMNIAGHYAVLMIYHFRDCLHSVKRNLEQTKVLQSKVEMPTVRQAIDGFGQQFPRARELRDQVGHFVDKIYSPEKLQKNRPPAEAFQHGVIDPSTRRLRFAHEGEPISQEISYGEAEKLRTVKLLMYSAFDGIASRPPAN